MATLPQPGRGPVVAWRPLSTTDVTAMQILMQASHEADGTHDEILSGDEIGHVVFERPGLDATLDSLGGWDAHGSLVVAGTVWCRPDHAVMGRVVLGGDVHPRVRRRGLGSTLLAWQEARAAERFSGLPVGLPRRIDLFVPADVAGREALARKAGYRPVRWFMAMERPLAELPARQPLPAGLRLSAWSDDLDEAVRDAANDAFRDHVGFEPVGQEAWRHRMAGHPGFLPRQSVLALDGARVAGFVLCRASGAEGGARPQAWLDLIGVRREWRRQGLASALMVEALAALHDTGHAQAMLGVDTGNLTGAIGLYERQGFRARRTEALFVRELRAIGPAG